MHSNSFNYNKFLINYHSTFWFLYSFCYYCAKLDICQTELNKFQTQVFTAPNLCIRTKLLIVFYFIIIIIINIIFSVQLQLSNLFKLSNKMIILKSSYLACFEISFELFVLFVLKIFLVLFLFIFVFIFIILLADFC